MGLDDVYQPIRSNILTRDPLPRVKTAFALISREESHRGIESNDVSNKSQNSAFVAKSNSQNYNNNKKFMRGPNRNLKCTKCGMIGHTIDRCYEVVGYPPGYKRKPFNQNAPIFAANNNNSVSEHTDHPFSSMPFTSEHIPKLMSLINDTPASSG